MSGKKDRSKFKDNANTSHEKEKAFLHHNAGLRNKYLSVNQNRANGGSLIAGQHNISSIIGREHNARSIESNGEVKDYFDNKISMRRSIEQKLRYEYSKNQVPSTYSKYKQPGKKEALEVRLMQYQK